MLALGLWQEPMAAGQPAPAVEEPVGVTGVVGTAAAVTTVTVVLGDVGGLPAVDLPQHH